MALRAGVVEGLFEVDVKSYNKIFKMTSNLGLAHNFSVLGLAAKSNLIYLDHVKAIIIYYINIEV